MSKNLDNVLIKSPHAKSTYSQAHIEEFVNCADPVSGPIYFLDHFFYIQHPTKGRMLYHPFEYQHRLIDTYHTYRYSISMMPRQTGKSTSAAGYLLWHAMFVPDSTILVAAHKYTGAQEIMQRIRYAYESVPDHIRAGVTSYNKGSLEFDNGSRIVSATTTENTGRGMSISLLYADEFAFVRPTIAKEFWTSISPTLATGGKAIITSTPNSDEDQFALLWKGANRCEDEYGNPTTVGQNGFKAYRSFWNEHPDRDESWAQQQRAALGTERFRREMDCIAGDSVLTLRDVSGRIFTASICELETMKDSTVEELVKNNIGLQVLTDAGWSTFDGVLNKGKKQIALVQLENSSIKATLDHEVFTDNFNSISVKQLKPGTKIRTTHGIQKVVSVTTSGMEKVYDLLNVEKNHRFYANNILCSNCEFIINDETLIAPTKLIDLRGIEPLFKTGEVRWYKQTVKDRIYTVSLDPSLGTGGDPAAIQVFEANTTEQVAEWRHNRTDIPTQIRIFTNIIQYIYDIVRDDKTIYYSVENNTIGEAALISIAEYGEENIKGYFLSDPQQSVSRRTRKGFNTTHKPKLAACAKLKNLVETNRMKINSPSLISELKNFVAVGTSYQAKIGETDDLVMSTILAVRMLQVLQSYHQNLDEQMRDHQDVSIEPLPFIATF